MVLHAAYQNFVAGFKSRCQAICHQVNGLGSALCPDDFLCAACIQKAAHCFAGTFKCRCGTVAQGVGAPMYIGVHFPVIAVHGIQNSEWLLRRRTIVQIHKRFPVHLL